VFFQRVQAFFASGASTGSILDSVSPALPPESGESRADTSEEAQEQVNDHAYRPTCRPAASEQFCAAFRVDLPMLWVWRDASYHDHGLLSGSGFVRLAIHTLSVDQFAFRADMVRIHHASVLPRICLGCFEIVGGV
jgi:hypothetical protein